MNNVSVNRQCVILVTQRFSQHELIEERVQTVVLLNRHFPFFVILLRYVKRTTPSIRFTNCLLYSSGIINAVLKAFSPMIINLIFSLQQQSAINIMWRRRLWQNINALDRCNTDYNVINSIINILCLFITQRNAVFLLLLS